MIDDWNAPKLSMRSGSESARPQAEQGPSTAIESSSLGNRLIFVVRAMHRVPKDRKMEASGSPTLVYDGHGRGLASHKSRSTADEPLPRVQTSSVLTLEPWSP